MTTLMPQPMAQRRYGLREAVRAEFTKIRTLRSTTWTLLATIVGTLLVTVLATSNIHRKGLIGPQAFDPTNQSLTGLAIGQLTIGLLGILLITGEYGSGTIRSSLAAIPRRPLLLGAKVIVIATISLVVSEILAFACFFTGRSILSGNAPIASLGDPGVLRALLMAGAYLALLGMFGLGLGVIIRHTAGAITTFVGVIFLLPVLLQPLHTRRATRVASPRSRYWPIRWRPSCDNPVRSPLASGSPSCASTAPPPSASGCCSCTGGTHDRGTCQ